MIASPDRLVTRLRGRQAFPSSAHIRVSSSTRGKENSKSQALSSQQKSAILKRSGAQTVCRRVVLAYLHLPRHPAAISNDQRPTLRRNELRQLPLSVNAKGRNP